MFACVAINKSAEPNSLVVRMDMAQRDLLIEEDPATYYLTDHYVDYPAVLVELGNMRNGDDAAAMQSAEGRARYAADVTQSAAEYPERVGDLGCMPAYLWVQLFTEGGYTNDGESAALPLSRSPSTGGPCRRGGSVCRGRRTSNWPKDSPAR